MKKLFAFAVSALLSSGLYSCNSPEKTDLVRSEPISIIDGDTLMCKTYISGLSKFRYVFSLTNGKRTIPKLFVAEFEDQRGNEAVLNVEKGAKVVRVTINKPIMNYSIPVDGITYELVGAK